MNQSIDARNLDCPQPVLLVREACENLPDDGILDVELNSYSSIENVKRFAKNQGIFCSIKSTSKDRTVLTLIKGYECALEPQKNVTSYVTLIFGSVISALLASTCCLAPFLFLVFGVSMSSLSFLQIFAPYTNYFSLFALAVIFYLWIDYFKSRKKKLVCETWLSKNYKMLLNIGTIVVIILVTYPYWVNYLLE